MREEHFASPCRLPTVEITHDLNSYKAVTRRPSMIENGLREDGLAARTAQTLMMLDFGKVPTFNCKANKIQSRYFASKL